MLKTQSQQHKEQRQQPQPLQPWESRSTLTGLGTRLSRILSLSPTSSAVSLSSTLAGDAGHMFKKTDSAIDATSDINSRSQSRGRDVFQSSGRGGAGNIRRTSTSRDPVTASSRGAKDGPDDFSQTRGREMNVTPAVTHSGRGGAGNIRSPSRDPTSPSSPSSSQYEKDIIRQHVGRDSELPHSSGRGGVGNIVSSAATVPATATATTDTKSRSRSGVRSSGRGGVGNMVPPTATTDNRDIAKLDEIERLKYHQHYHHDGMHSTGRGGAANITSAHSPGIDLPPIHESQGSSGDNVMVSSGRGGAGNMRQTSRSRTRGG